MNQAELISAVAGATGTTKSGVTLVLSGLADVITTALRDKDEVTLPQLGKLVLKPRAARKGRNPITGAVVDIAAKNAVGFKAAKVLRDAMNYS